MLLLLVAMAAREAHGQISTLECVAFTSGGFTDASGDVLVLGQAFAGTTSASGVELEAGLLACLVGGCRADFDGDGELTLFDFLAFSNAFGSGDTRADFDGDGLLTLFDFLSFSNEFATGCA